MAHIWIRAEDRAEEKRTGITPAGVQALMAAGHQITVERSANRIIPDADYAAIGCAIAAPLDWHQAPDNAIIFGLKELDPNGPDLRHRHILFGHAFKGQADGPALLNRFKRGGGALYDLEYLTDPSGRRVAAFGYWAGFAGAAMGVKVWAAQQAGDLPGPARVRTYNSRNLLISDLESDLSAALANGTTPPTMIVIGALGRVGSGACDLADALNIPVTKWDMAETASGGPFPKILDHSIFVNAILANPQVPVFVPKTAITAPRTLTVISDVSCDPNSPYNPIPIYDNASSFDAPLTRVTQGPPPLDVTAIDNLPSMLPLESSEDFAQQLLPSLLELDHLDTGVWARARDIFDQHLAALEV